MCIFDEQVVEIVLEEVDSPGKSDVEVTVDTDIKGVVDFIVVVFAEAAVSCVVVIGLLEVLDDETPWNIEAVFGKVVD